jgi:dipeptidyl aminopeptidase/acylaminoacyl peptidase
MSGFEPRHLLDERLVLAADARGEVRIWSVRRPRDDGREYRVELWRRDGDGEPRQVELPFSLAAPPRLTASGQLALVSSATGGPPQLWLADADADAGGGGADQVSGDRHVLDAEPNPVDDRIAFRASAGPPRFLVGGDVARRIAAVDFLADGVGFRDHRIHVFLYERGSVRQLTDGDFDVHASGWAADGRALWLLVGRVDDRPYETHELWTLEPDGTAQPEVAVADPGWVSDAALSPDATLLAWLARDDLAEESRLWLLDRKSGERRRIDGGLCVEQSTFPDLLPQQASRTQIDWEDDGNAIVAIATVRGTPTPYRFPLDGEPPRTLADGVSVGFLRRAGGATLVVGVESERPAELLELTAEGKRRLSDHGGWFPSGAWPRVEELTVRNGEAEVHGWVMEAAGGAPANAPLVLHVHGGPYSAHGPVPWLEMAALAARGYRVLVPNPRGSVSYGDAWSTAIAGRWGTLDADDLHAFLDGALERDLGDPDRIGLIGLSYGGYMTVHLLGTSDRFRAAVAENPVTNFISQFGMSDLGALGARLFSGSDEIRLDDWLRASPLYHAEQITTPLLLLQGERDDRCPLPESMQVYAILKALGREVELVRIPDESHLMFALARPDRRVYRLESILEWFDRHLVT